MQFTFREAPLIKEHFSTLSQADNEASSRGHAPHIYVHAPAGQSLTTTKTAAGSASASLHLSRLQQQYTSLSLALVQYTISLSPGHHKLSGEINRHHGDPRATRILFPLTLALSLSLPRVRACASSTFADGFIRDGRQILCLVYAAQLYSSSQELSASPPPQTHTSARNSIFNHPRGHD